MKGRKVVVTTCLIIKTGSTWMVATLKSLSKIVEREALLCSGALGLGVAASKK